MLQQLLTGNELAGAGAETMGQEEGIAAINAARETYSLKLVDVNSTNKGSPAGGVQSFSAMVVVGDGEVLRLHAAEWDALSCLDRSWHHNVSCYFAI